MCSEFPYKFIIQGLSMPLEEKAKVVLERSEMEKSTESNIDIVLPTEKIIPSSTTDEEKNFFDEDDQKEVQEVSSQEKLVEEKLYSDRLAGLEEKIACNSVAQKELELKVIQTLKENANFQIQVRQNMQKELEDAKKKLSGDIFIPLLKEIAELYVEWQDVLNDLEEGITKRKVAGIFEVLQEILEGYGCEFGTSEINSKRRPKYSKLKNKVPTGYKEIHETVAKSHNTWIVKEPFVLYPEYVDVYVYDSSLSKERSETITKTESDNIQEED